MSSAPTRRRARKARGVLEPGTRLKLNFVAGHDEELVKRLGAPLSEETKVFSRYECELRIIVPTVRTHAAAGERLALKVLLPDRQPAKIAALYFRPMGKVGYAKLDLTHLSRAVCQAKLPPAKEDLE